MKFVEMTSTETICGEAVAVDRRERCVDKSGGDEKRAFCEEYRDSVLIVGRIISVRLATLRRPLLFTPEGEKT